MCPCEDYHLSSSGFYWNIRVPTLLCVSLMTIISHRQVPPANMRVPTLVCVSLKNIICHRQVSTEIQEYLRYCVSLWRLSSVIIRSLLQIWEYLLSYGRSQRPRCLRCGCTAVSIAENAGSNPFGLWMSLVSVVYCQVEISATGRSPVEGSPAECGVSECHRGTSYRGRRPTMAVRPRQGKRPQYTSLWILSQVIVYMFWAINHFCINKNNKNPIKWDEHGLRM